MSALYRVTGGIPRNNAKYMQFVRSLCQNIWLQWPAPRKAQGAREESRGAWFASPRKLHPDTFTIPGFRVQCSSSWALFLLVPLTCNFCSASERSYCALGQLKVVDSPWSRSLRTTSTFMRFYHICTLLKSTFDCYCCKLFVLPCLTRGCAYFMFISTRASSVPFKLCLDLFSSRFSWKENIKGNWVITTPPITRDSEKEHLLPVTQADYAALHSWWLLTVNNYFHLSKLSLNSFLIFYAYRCVESGLQFRYQASWSAILEVIRVVFEVLDSVCFFSLQV